MLSCDFTIFATAPNTLLASYILAYKNKIPGSFSQLMKSLCILFTFTRISHLLLRISQIVINQKQKAYFIVLKDQIKLSFLFTKIYYFLTDFLPITSIHPKAAIKIRLLLGPN